MLISLFRQVAYQILTSAPLQNGEGSPAEYYSVNCSSLQNGGRLNTEINITEVGREVKYRN
jgi:hypothetical protein